MSGNGTQALSRGLAILNLLKSCYPGGMRVSEIAETLELNRTTVQRMIVPLEDNNWVKKQEDGRRYFQFDVGFKHPIKKPSDILDADAVPIGVIETMRGLADAFGDAVFLVMKDGHDSLGVHREIGRYPVQIMGTYPGKRHALGVGAPSMALLVAMDDDSARAAVQANLARLKTDYPDVTPDLIWRLRSNARDRGYVVMKNYAVLRTTGVAKWFRMSGFDTFFAIGVGGISERMTVAKQGLIARFMQERLEKLTMIDLMTN